MYRSIIKGVVLLASTAVAVPYAVAALCNLLYGWPQTKNRYKRALNPRKVYRLNYSVLQQLLKLRYASLFLQWKTYYRRAGPELIKNLVYGRNDNTLDLYQPNFVCRKPDNKPVVIFVYGGSWGSGDKNMYCLVCKQIANKLGAVVCCPNYSIHPRGYVDDMVQDVVDCISWAYENINDYGGDKEKILLLGHSAGAHLCAMAILELLHDERTGAYPYPTNQSILFDETHYNGNDNNGGSSGSSESFSVVSENGDQAGTLEASTNSGTFELLKSQTDSSGDGASTSKEVQSDVITQPGERTEGLKGAGSQVVKSGKGTEETTEEEEEYDDSGDNDSIVTVRPKDIERHPTLVDLCKSVKGFIGLAGVYNIRDHYEHEGSRGIEDVSSMGQAMYGDDHFDRFSPTVIVKNLKKSISIPKTVLVHGTDDFVVPLSSTTKFGEALSDVLADVTVRILPDCDHYSVCLDLMLPTRKFYDSVMGIIMETSIKLFNQTS